MPVCLHATDQELKRSLYKKVNLKIKVVGTPNKSELEFIYLPLVLGEDLHHHYISIKRSVTSYDAIQKYISCVVLQA